MIATGRIRLVGACTRCGQCCTAEQDGRLLVCAHLEVAGRLGEPEATRCAIYATREDGRAIVLLDAATGMPVRSATCAVGSIREDITIIARGLGRGCPLTVAHVEED